MTLYAHAVAYGLAYAVVFGLGVAVGIVHERNRRRLSHRQRTMGRP